LIDRTCVGKEYPPFSVRLSADLAHELETVLGITVPEPEQPHGPPPLIWPALMTSHGTACLIPLWEDLGVHPLDPRLISEEFTYLETPTHGEELNGCVRIEDIGEHVEPDIGIEEQVDLCIEFRNSQDNPVASYRCSYRIPVAVAVR